MKAAERKVFRAWVAKTIRALRTYMYLDNWRVVQIWESEPSKDEPNTAAHIDTDTRYFQAVLYLMPCLEEIYKEDGKPRVAEILTHELCHLITEPLYEMACDQSAPALRKHLNTVREQTTQMMAICVFRGIPENLYQ